MSSHRRLEDLIVYQKLCSLHIEISAISHKWPVEEKYDDRHVRNKIEGVNRSRGEAAETVHHFYVEHLKGYETMTAYDEYRARYNECICMLNGMERTLEKQLPEADRRWPSFSVKENDEAYGGFPETLNPEP